MFIVRAASFHVKRRLIVLWALLRSLGDHMESTVNICSSCINTGIRNMGEEVFRCSDRNPVCVSVCVCVCLFMYMYVCSVAQFCLTLRDPMHCSPPGSSVYGILQARTLEWVAMPSSKGSSSFRDWSLVSFLPLVPPGKPQIVSNKKVF